MTNEELQEYTTSHERQLEFRDSWAKDGFYYTIDANMIEVDGGPAAMIEVKVFKRVQGGSILYGNGFAMEERNLSEFNRFHYFATAQTKAISRALASIGIGIDKNLATIEDVTINADTIVVEQKKARRNGLPKVVSVEDTLLRLRVKHEIVDGQYVVTSTKLKDKTQEVLKRYGFKKNTDGKLTAPVPKEIKDDREQL